jgi:hypothetical protein
MLLFCSVEKYGRAGYATYDIIIQRMRFACWITMATHDRSEYIIHNAFPLQQWFRKRASLLHYTYTACIVKTQTQEFLLRGMEGVFIYTRFHLLIKNYRLTRQTMNVKRNNVARSRIIVAAGKQ